MTRSFIEMPVFTRLWQEAGLTDHDLSVLQDILLKKPDAGPIMKGTGGLRKLRYALHHHGKSGGVRICYIDFEEYGLIYLITVFKKSDKENLTDSEKNELKRLVKILRDEASKNRR